MSRARRLYLRAARKGLWTEIRLDHLQNPDLTKIFRTLPGPVIVTNRHPEDGGKWVGDERNRCRLLEAARDLGVTCVDLEFRSDPLWVEEMCLLSRDTRIIHSYHDFSGTTDTADLEDLLDNMLHFKSDIIKIVTWARQPEDNLRVLSLIPKARARGREIIAFCLGPLGKWSRIAAPFLGSFLTYAPFTRKGASAPGQLTVNEIRRIWRTLK